MNVETYDGNDKVIFSKSIITYENRLTIKNLQGINFEMIFENTEPEKGQQDVSINGASKKVTLTFSRKFRNALGAGTTKKIVVASNKEDGELLLLSIYGNAIGNDMSALNITVTFYLRTNE